MIDSRMGMTDSLDPHSKLWVTGFQEVVSNEEQMVEYYFTDVSFWEVDTHMVDVNGTYSITPSPWRVRPVLRLAVDREGKVYRIFGFDTCEYNDMISANPLHVDNYSVYNYGRFYLDLFGVYEIGDYHYLTSVNDFLALNKSIMLDSCTCNHPDKPWESEKRNLRSLLAEAKLGKIEFLEAEKKFAVDYYVWLQNTGDLFHHVLSISTTGQCEVVFSEKIAEKVGYWTNLGK